MSGAAGKDAPTRLDLESAIMDAEGAAAVLSILEDHLTSSTAAGWKTLGLEAPEDWCVHVLTSTESRALSYAGQNLQDMVAEVSRVFYAMDEGRTGLWAPF